MMPSYLLLKMDSTFITIMITIMITFSKEGNATVRTVESINACNNQSIIETERKKYLQDKMLHCTARYPSLELSAESSPP